MFLIRLPLVLVWGLLSCVLGLVICVFRWGNIDNDWVFSRIFAWAALPLAGVEVEAEGLEHLEARQPCIYVANHQSNFDLAIFSRIYPHRTVVIGKKELYWIPLFGLFFAAAGNIMINRQKKVKALAGLDQAVAAIRERKASIWIFPEGTRNRSQDPLLPFKKGAFHMAIQAGVPVVPIVSSPLRSIASRTERRAREGSVFIKVLPPVPTEGMTGADVERLSQLVRAQMEAAIRDCTR